MNTSATFRPLRPPDAPECARLHGQAFAPSWTADEFRRQIGQPNHVLTGAVVGASDFASDLAGFALDLAGFASSRTVDEEADLLTIAVDVGRRGSGIGRCLLRHHLSSLSEAGVKTVFLEVGARNDAARALYQTTGFVPVGGRKAYYGAGDGLWEDAVTMRCVLQGES